MWNVGARQPVTCPADRLQNLLVKIMPAFGNKMKYICPSSYSQRTYTYHCCHKFVVIDCNTALSKSLSDQDRYKRLDCQELKPIIPPFVPEPRLLTVSLSRPVSVGDHRYLSVTGTMQRTIVSRCLFSLLIELRLCQATKRYVTMTTLVY